MLSIISQIPYFWPSTCSLKLIPGALLGLFVVYAGIPFFTYYSHSAFLLFFPYLDLGPFLLAILLERWKGVDGADKRSIFLLAKHFGFLTMLCGCWCDGFQMTNVFGEISVYLWDQLIVDAVSARYL